MVVRILLVLFLFALHAFAAETAKDSSAVVADTLAKDTTAKDSSRHKGNSIPLPRQSAYTGYGLLVGLAAGIFNPTE